MQTDSREAPGLAAVVDVSVAAPGVDCVSLRRASLPRRRWTHAGVLY
jgi:hypothetical protein